MQYSFEWRKISETRGYIWSLVSYAIDANGHVSNEQTIKEVYVHSYKEVENAYSLYRHLLPTA